MPLPLPFPGVQHGKRIIISVIEQRSHEEPDSSWISIPVDDRDLSKGYKDITYKQLNDAANHAAHWLLRNLPPSSQPFQCLAYAGPKDLRYPILAVAAGKLQKKVRFSIDHFLTFSANSIFKLFLPNLAMTPESHANVLRKADCQIYISTDDVANAVNAALQHAPGIHYMSAPELDVFFQKVEPIPITYTKSWDDAKDDPWLVFHTSGTTGEPRPLPCLHVISDSSVKVLLAMLFTKS